MKKTRIFQVQAALALAAIAGMASYAISAAPGISTDGAVTPSGMKITVTGISVVTAANEEISLWSGSREVEFLRSGKAFEAISLSEISIPDGRYIGIKMRFSDRYKVKLDGDKLAGGAGHIAAGTALYTTTAVSDSSQANSYSTVSGAATYVTLPSVSNCSDCTNTTYFAKPACVAASAGNCEAGDQYVGGDGTTLPDVSILVDLYQSVEVDAQIKALSRGAVYPYAMLGKPGAAIHLVDGDQSTGTKNVSLIFGSDKRLLSVATWSGGGGTTGVTGGSWVTATAGPSLNAYGPTFVSDFDATTGKVQFPSGNCLDSNQCTSSGLIALSNVLQAVGSSVTVTCTADTTGALGYTYTGGSCSGISGGTMKVARIIDPSNLFGVCADSSGVCSASNAQVSGSSSDGYL